MLAFLGDIHGLAYDLNGALEKIKRHNELAVEMEQPERVVSAMIQVGDWGWYSHTKERFSRVNADIPIYWIDGNHEDHDLLYEYDKVTEIFPNQFFIPRGTVLELDGRRIAFMGGAASVDKDIRIRQKMHWSEKEQITEAEIRKLDNVGHIDILVTHTPPQSLIDRYFDPNALAMFGLPPTWRDPSAAKLERLWAELGYPQLFCGHMHRSVVGEKHRILNINELFFF